MKHVLDQTMGVLYTANAYERANHERATHERASHERS